MLQKKEYTTKIPVTPTKTNATKEGTTSNTTKTNATKEGVPATPTKTNATKEGIPTTKLPVTPYKN